MQPNVLDLYEAANEEEAAKVAMISLSLGALTAETWTLLPYQRYGQLAKELRKCRAWGSWLIEACVNRDSRPRS